jgi:hypothetical protein
LVVVKLQADATEGLGQFGGFARGTGGGIAEPGGIVAAVTGSLVVFPGSDVPTTRK